MTFSKTLPPPVGEPDQPRSHDAPTACTRTQVGRREFLKLAGGLVAISAVRPAGATAPGWPPDPITQPPAACAPGWQGAVLIDGESLTHWAVEQDAGAAGALQLAPGLIGQAVRLDWQLGTGQWVQGCYAFPTPVDLGQADTFGISLRGGGAGEIANTVGLMFADVHDVFYGFDLPAQASGINQVDRWLINLAFPKQAFWYFWGSRPQIDWSQITRFFIVVKRPDAASGGGAGQLWLDHVQYATAAHWPRQTQFEAATGDLQAAARALGYILSQQDPSTGLFVSWQEEEAESPPPKAWLYDQALVLLALTRAGSWQAGSPTNAAAQAAENLVAFISVAQKADGHWARGWQPRTGQELLDDGWVGDQGWWVMALGSYARKSGRAAALAAAQRGADWLARQIDAAGKVTASTEGNVDAWWALMGTSRFSDADKIKNYLLQDGVVWDAELRYWWRGFNDPVIALDTATWLSHFARHPAVNQPARAHAALSFVRQTLVTSSQDGRHCGLDGMGPLSIWNEGTAQYVAAGGAGAQDFLEGLVARQQPDGALLGSTERWGGNIFGWLTTWRGLAPTAWFYFAITGAPFPVFGDVFLPLVVQQP
jgi:hypothetical protein